jgi:hypothetical protein
MSVKPELARGKIGAASINEALEDAVTMDSFTVAGVPSAATYAGKLIHVSNGAGGAPCLAYSNGTSWLRILMGVAVNATT